MTHPRWCQDGHVHFSMVKTKKKRVSYVDPSRYMERREMPPPACDIECNHYALIFRVGLNCHIKLNCQTKGVLY